MLESITRPRMRSSLATLASMHEDDFAELVWENGQILMRGISGRTQKGHSCSRTTSASSLYPSVAQAENGGNMHTKRARLETVCSISNDSTFSGFMGHRDSDLNFTNNNSDLHSFPELYRFNLDGSKRKSKSDDDDDDDEHPTDSQTVLEHDRPRSRQLDPSDSLMRSPRLNSSETQVSVSELHTSSLLDQRGSHPDKKTRAVNFSNLRPAAVFKANSQSSNVTRPTYGTVVSTRVDDQEFKGSKYESNTVEPTVIEPATTVSKSATALQNQPQADLIPSVGEIKESLPEAFGHMNHKSSDQQANTEAGKVPNINKFAEPAVASSSVRSLGASNDPTYSFRRTYEDTESSEYRSEDFTRNGEEPQGLIKQAFVRGGTSAKRSRTAQVHNLSERVDKASMLDEAIEYLKTLQLQLLIMSMGSGLCIPPMMLPTTMQNIMCAPLHLTHFSPMGCNPGQFPTSDLPGITGTRFQMLGFPMSVSHPPFVPFVGMPSTQSVAAPGIHGAEPPPLRNINQYDSNQK
ncbi:transcription factor PHYTOCHROME INTERACTING FACTOR-LIKE 15-like isoform X2 [Alnus glutinosa]|uniref:transcription factor PHYTOCHROME INTERACTING FACTOR-LIKE 15-like isoform X2 n=1 Tax=Alnus glutinosa TaxID=3517 RepID=UPI002D77A6B3|nr:transcription factor PHYTOCHROME INTERACTING FACTOR-LIKE 15-like isoform X2 [Alnus glutinosa]